MGMTFWFGVRGKTAAEYDQVDHSPLCRAAKELDAICDRLQKPRLSSFVDTTDAAFNMGPDGNGPDDDAEPPGVDQMQWFEPDAARPTVAALIDALTSDTQANSTKVHRLNEVIDDLREIAAALDEAKKRRKKFHLAVLM